MPALSGMRILDLTQYEAGPSATQALAWLGADVVKVEKPGKGDPGRGGAVGSDSPYFVNWNCNKRSVVIDLDQPAGRELLLKLVPHYDVLAENYGPGVAEKLEISYDAIAEVHPQIIYARIKGFGTSGPYSSYKCFDMVAQAAAGAFSVTGEADGPPMKPGPTMADSGTGVQMALAITAAYVQKLQTGEGQLIEISMQEAMTYYMRTVITHGRGWGMEPAPRNGAGIGGVMNLYPCKPFGPNDYAYIMVITRRMWETLCKVIERPDLIEDPRFSRPSGRYQHPEELYEEIAKWTRQHTKQEAMRRLGEAGVPCSAVFDTHDLLTDPHLRARGFLTEIEHPTYGEVPMLGWAPRLSKSDVPIVPSPLLGEHTNQVMAQDLGLSEAEIGELRRRGTIA